MENENKKSRIRQVFSKRNILRFLDKQGFYIVLFLCLCIIGTTAFLTSTGGMWWRQSQDQPEDLPISGEDSLPAESGSETIDIEITDVIGQDKPDTEDKTVPDTSKAPKTPVKDSPVVPEAPPRADKETSAKAPAPSQPAQPVSSTVKTGMMMPVEGDIIKGFAMDELVYSRTLKEWKTHSGIDIEGELGSEVRAAMEGTVASVVEDALMGIIITLDHGDGLQTVYAGLSTKDMVRVGQRVEMGQVISGIGNTAAVEIADAPHLHFEVVLDGEYQDPITYLKR